jgi:two-component sensor histidine kinase
LNLMSSPTLAVFRSTIGLRVESLAKTHTLLTTQRRRAIAFRDINAAKYGPLCSPGGRIEIRWTAETTGNETMPRTRLR